MHEVLIDQRYVIPVPGLDQVMPVTTNSGFISENYFVPQGGFYMCRMCFNLPKEGGESLKVCQGPVGPPGVDKKVVLGLEKALE